MKTDAEILIVGAGLAGLTAARELSRERRDVMVLDKGRGAGGRMSTRRHGGGRFDHGAQFMTVRSQAFAQIMDEWVAAGVATHWTDGFGDGHTGDGSILGEAAAEHMPARDGHPRYRGVPGMSAIPKHLAAGTQAIDVRLGVQALSVQLRSDGVRVTPTEGPDFHARSVILTPPVPQTLALLANGAIELDQEQQRTFAAIEYDPCLVLLTFTEQAVSLPEPGVLRRPSSAIHWIADNQQKGVSDRGPALTVHFSAEFSREHYEDDSDELLGRLISETRNVLPFEPVAPQLKKWRFSQPVNPLNHGAIGLSSAPQVILAGDAFSGARVEGAVLSGLSAAGKALSVLS